MVYLLVGCFILFDFGTGIVKALKQKKFTSTVMREGLFHKCASIMWVVFGGLVDYAQTMIDLGITIPLAGSICAYIVLMECGSIMENLGEINPNLVPHTIRQHFTKLKTNE